MSGGAAPGDGSSERWVVAALDHFASLRGYRPVPAQRPGGGGWRRLYLPPAVGVPILAAVAPEGSRWVSLGVEVRVPRATLLARLPAVLAALAAYEVAVDPDAAAGDGEGDDAVLRLALRLFTEGMTPSVLADAAENLAEAESEARRALV